MSTIIFDARERGIDRTVFRVEGIWGTDVGRDGCAGGGRISSFGKRGGEWASNPVSSVDAVLIAAAQQVSGSTAAMLAQELQQLTGQLRQLQTVSQAAVESTQKNTQAAQTVSQNSSSGGGTSVGSAILNAFGSGLSPLISGVARLFGGGGSETPAPLMKFALPSALNVDAGVSRSAGGGAFGVDTAQGNLPRPVTQTVLGPQAITVNVQAMDSRSFLDHSHDIALAVRQAMLESNVLNDVVREA
ncbi:MAG: hypothetical protein WDO18_21040 [Acidobacteriota bacterium]